MRVEEEVEFAHLNYIYKAAAVPNDQFFNYQWHYPLINLPQAWDVTKGSSNIVVAVIDTGVTNHPDLASRFTNSGVDMISLPQISLDGDGIDFDPSDPGDTNLQFGKSTWHGTHVAGTVGAETDNGVGVSGVDWFCRIMPVRVLGKGGGTDFDICEGIRFAAGLNNASFAIPAKKADVLNLSLGGPNASQNCQNAIASAKANGSVVICAAGNDNTSQPFFPAAYDGSISVSSVDLNKQRAYYSNFGSTIDVAAPGGDVTVDLNQDNLNDGVLSTFIDEDAQAFAFFTQQGTSMAAPHVAGVAALILSANPSLSPDQVEEVLKGTAEDIGAPGFDQFFGEGLVDAFAAVQLAANAQTPALSLSTQSLDFGTGQTSIGVGISNAGGGVLTWNATEQETSGGDWLSLQSSSGTAPSTLNVQVDRTGVPVGVYFGQVQMTSNGGNATISVRMEVAQAGGPPLLVVSTTGLNFGANTTTLNLSIQNGGGGVLNYTATNSETAGGDWLDHTPTSGGLSGGASQTVIVNVDRTGLAPGAYAGTVLITSNGGNASVAVSMNVASGNQPVLSLTADSVHFPAAVSQAQIGVFNVGGGTLSFTATDNEFGGGNWLGVSPSAGTAPQTVTVTVNRTGLQPGSYSGQVMFSSNGGNQSVAITMEVVGQSLSPIDLGTVFVLAVDPFTLKTKAQGAATQLSPGYLLSSVKVGTWLLVAGPDLDNDNFICGIGEPCGIFPVAADPVPILVTSGAVITGADFAVSPDLVLPTLYGTGFQIPHGGFELAD